MRTSSKLLVVAFGAVVLGCTGGSDDFVIRETGFGGGGTCADFDDRPDLPGTVYVAWSADGDGDGTREQPLVTLEAALALSPRQIVVAPGTYPEDVVVTTGHDVELLAACADQETFVRGLTVDDGVLLLGGVRVQSLRVSGGAVSGGGAVLDEVDVTGGALALETTSFGDVRIEGGSFSSVEGDLWGTPALHAGPGATALIEGGLVSGPLLLDQDGAQVTVSGASLDVGVTAVATVSADASLVLLDVDVPQTAVALLLQSDGQVSISGMDAICRRADGPSILVSGGTLSVEGSALELDQIAVTGGAVTLTDVALTRSLRTDMPAWLVTGGALTVDGAVLLAGTSERTWAGVAHVTGGALDATDVHARTLADGAALVVGGDGVLSCTDCSLHGAASVVGGTLVLTDSQLTAGVHGVALDGLAAPSTATLSGVTLDNAGNVGLYARGDVDLEITDTTFGSGPVGVAAVGLGDDAFVLSGADLHGHSVVGVLLDGSGAALSDLTFSDNGLDLKQQTCADVTPVHVDGANQEICEGAPLALPNWPL